MNLAKIRRFFYKKTKFTKKILNKKNKNLNLNLKIPVTTQIKDE